MKTFWYIIYMLILIFVVLLLPFSMFYYESDETENAVLIYIKLKMYLKKNNYLEKKIKNCILYGIWIDYYSAINFAHNMGIFTIF